MSATEYGERVADLIEAAFDAGSSLESGTARRDRKVQAARALAALELGKQAAVRNLLLVATVSDELGANLALRREAFLQATRLLGLIDENDNDPADTSDETKAAQNGTW